METLQSNLGWFIFITVGIFVILYQLFSKNQQAFTSKFKAKQTLNTDFNESRKLVQQALANASFTKIGFDSKENKFQALSGFSMYSWSEFIQVTLTHSATNTELEFQSICAFPLQVFDWGKNKRNFRKFDNELKKLSASAL